MRVLTTLLAALSTATLTTANPVNALAVRAGTTSAIKPSSTATSSGESVGNGQYVDGSTFGFNVTLRSAYQSFQPLIDGTFALCCTAIHPGASCIVEQTLVLTPYQRYNLSLAYIFTNHVEGFSTFNSPYLKQFLNLTDMEDNVWRRYSELFTPMVEDSPLQAIIDIPGATNQVCFTQISVMRA